MARNKDVQRHYPDVILKPGREQAVLRGHPWVFSGALKEGYHDLIPGEVVRLRSSHGEPLALGFYNPRSDIAVRILTRNPQQIIDVAFWRQRIGDAGRLRARIIPPHTSAWRIVNAEGDGLPGLVADRYGDYIVLSLETAGMDTRRDEIIAALVAEIAPRGIYERSGGRARRREGRGDRQGSVWGEEPPEWVTIEERGIIFAVDVKGGQKTGFYLDQRENRELMKRLSNGAQVLNCFAYTGGFSLYALLGGAKEVTSVEISRSAIETMAHHVDMNGIDRERSPDDLRRCIRFFTV